jgi:hypothetical protein
MQRQLRLGDTLDDYCPRERRLTNHVIVAMVEADVKQTRCTTCDAEHEYKHARIPRQRKKSEAPAALYAQVLAGGPKRVVHDPEPASEALVTDDELPQDEGRPAEDDRAAAERAVAAALGVDLDRGQPVAAAASSAADESDDHPADEAGGPQPGDDGFVHRRLIRAQLPRIEGQPPAPRQAPDFTIRQPAGRPGRFRQRGPRPGQGSGQGGGQGFGGRSGNSGGGGPMRSGSRPHGGPHPMNARSQKHQGSGRKRSR